MMNDTILLVDYQNVRDSGLSDLPDHRRLLLFVGKGQKPKATFIESAMKCGVRVDLVPITEEGNNNLDFHLAFYLGRLLMEEPYGEFVIVSNDRDFEPLVRHLQSLGVSCERHPTLKAAPQKTKTIQAAPVVKTATAPPQKSPAPQQQKPAAAKATAKKTTSKFDEYMKKAIAFLEKETPDKLPATKHALLEYIIEKLKIDSSFAGQLVVSLKSGGTTKIDKGRVTYNLRKIP